MGERECIPKKGVPTVEKYALGIDGFGPFFEGYISSKRFSEWLPRRPFAARNVYGCRPTNMNAKIASTSGNRTRKFPSRQLKNVPYATRIRPVVLLAVRISY